MLKLIKKLFALKPYNTGFLPEQDGHSIFYQQFGNPDGQPALYFHGGPGARSKTSHAKLFDLKNQRVILFDQRGCGRSLAIDVFKNNIIQATADDAKRLLQFLNISGKITVAGGSWGATCALLFTMTYPELAQELLLTKVLLGPYGDCTDVSDISPATELFYPDMLGICREMAGSADLADYYWGKAISDNPDDQRQALEGYGALEGLLGQADVKMPQIDHIDAKSLNYTRIFLHYVKNKFFLADDWVEKGVGKLAGMPVRIYHNRLDMVCPLKQAYYLHKKLPGSRLEIIPDSGHGGKKMSAKILADNRAKFRY